MGEDSFLGDPAEEEQQSEVNPKTPSWPWNPTASPEPKPNGNLVLPTVSLSQVLKNEETGLRYEEMSGGVQTKFRSQASTFIQFRHGKMASKKKVAWVADCYKHPGEDLFCDYMVSQQGGAGAKLESPRSAGERSSRSTISKVIEDLSKGRITELQPIREGLIYRAMKSFSTWEPIQATAETALAAYSCPSTSLLAALGSKAEEFLPDPKFRALAIALYSRAADCGSQTDDSASKARYRLSLQYIWDNQCKKAAPLLHQLSEQKDGDYIARAVYWQAYCAKQVGDTSAFTTMRSRLLRDYPLSYHALIIDSVASGDVSKFLKVEEPVVMFRSQQRSELNSLVRVIEVLQMLKATELSREFLDDISERLDRTEPAFRLYIAVLLNRAGETIPTFRMLSSVFHDQPATISRTTLELFYPLRRFEVLRRYGAKVDPYLVAALIRQESAFNERARSAAGALGLMQLMPHTARRMERVSRRELLDAKTNVRLGVKYFYRLIDKYNGDAELALAAYNAGPEKVDDWIRRYPTQNRVLFLDLIPFKETREYVAIISRNYYWYLSLYANDMFDSVTRSIRKLASGKKPVVFTMFNSL